MLITILTLFSIIYFGLWQTLYAFAMTVYYFAIFGIIIFSILFVSAILEDKSDKPLSHKIKELLW